MIQNILKIELSDSGTFYENTDLTQLWLEVNIESKVGMFKKQSDIVFENTVHDKYDLIANDKFYFLPGVTIPRMKLKDIYNTHKIRTVRDVDLATRIFVGSKTVDKITDDTWEFAVKTDSLITFIDAAFENKNMDEYYYNKLKDALEFYKNELVLTNRHTNNILSHSDIPYQVSDNWLNQGSNRFITVTKDYTKLFDELIGKDLYIEDALMDYINGPDAVIIDDQMFSTLSDMFNSDDRDNWMLSMEIMANCDYKKSLLYLALLFHDYGNRMENVSSKNHVNFKALTLYLNVNRGLSITPDEVVDILIFKNGVTRDNMAIVLKLFGPRINTYGSSKHFIPKAVSFSDEIDLLLNEEVVHVLKDTPVFKIAQIEELTESPEEDLVQDELIVEPINKINEPDTTFDTFEF